MDYVDWYHEMMLVHKTTMHILSVRNTIYLPLFHPSILSAATVMSGAGMMIVRPSL